MAYLQGRPMCRRASGVFARAGACELLNAVARRRLIVRPAHTASHCEAPLAGHRFPTRARVGRHGPGAGVVGVCARGADRRPGPRPVSAARRQLAAIPIVFGKHRKACLQVLSLRRRGQPTRSLGGRQIHDDLRSRHRPLQSAQRRTALVDSSLTNATLTRTEKRNPYVFRPTVAPS